jgi:hypothetical protein
MVILPILGLGIVAGVIYVVVRYHKGKKQKSP